MNQEEANQKWSKIIAKAWMDENYKKRLIENPKEILAQEGLEFPKDLNLRIVEDTDKIKTLVIPPTSNSTEHLQKIEDRLAATFLPSQPGNLFFN
jgi:hypothetical protein